MDFKSFIERVWVDHADDAAAVAARLHEGLPLVSDEAQIPALAGLAHHVYGEHLGDWPAGLAFMQRLAALPACRTDGPSGQALRRSGASLSLSQGAGAELSALSTSDRIRVSAMAASNLAGRDTVRALRLFQQALDEARHSGLATADPMNRALAVTGNALACTLEEKTPRSADERALMILAAQTARHHWALAGTWLEVERAEYRLAMTWLHAGDPAQARQHAQACLDIVAANDGAALERLFGWEALGLVERAAGNPAGHAHALAMARTAFAQLSADDQGWCAESIAKLASTAP